MKVPLPDSAAGRSERSGRRLPSSRGGRPAQLLTELCAELDLVHVVDPMQTETVTPEQTYYRLHGTTGWRHVHTDERFLGLLSR